jgi:hypothetical protein
MNEFLAAQPSDIKAINKFNDFLALVIRTSSKEDKLISILERAWTEVVRTESKDASRELYWKMLARLYKVSDIGSTQQLTDVTCRCLATTLLSTDSPALENCAAIVSEYASGHDIGHADLIQAGVIPPLAAIVRAQPKNVGLLEQVILALAQICYRDDSGFAVSCLVREKISEHICDTLIKCTADNDALLIPTVMLISQLARSTASCDPIKAVVHVLENHLKSLWGNNNLADLTMLIINNALRASKNAAQCWIDASVHRRLARIICDNWRTAPSITLGSIFTQLYNICRSCESHEPFLSLVEEGMLRVVTPLLCYYHKNKYLVSPLLKLTHRIVCVARDLMTCADKKGETGFIEAVVNALACPDLDDEGYDWGIHILTEMLQSTHASDRAKATAMKARFASAAQAITAATKTTAHQTTK